MIKTWEERLEVLPRGHITTNADVQGAMLDEIDELRAQLALEQDTLHASSEATDALLRQALEALVPMQMEASHRGFGLRICDEAIAAIRKHLESDHE